MAFGDVLTSLVTVGNIIDEYTLREIAIKLALVKYQECFGLIERENECTDLIS